MSSSDEIEGRLRSALQGVCHCDLRNDLPLGLKQENLTPVDAILSCFTLEVVAREEEKLVAYFKKFCSMLTNGGRFMMIGVGNLSF